MVSNKQNYKSSLRAIFLLFFLVGVFTASGAVAEYNISEISWDDGQDGSFTLRIKGDSEPTYTMYEMFGPQRIVLDIAEGDFSSEMDWPLDIASGPVGMVKGGKDGSGPARLEIFLAEDRNYTINTDGSNVLVQFEKIADVKGGEIGKAANVVSITDIQVDATSAESAVVTLYGSGPIATYMTSEEDKTERHSARLIIDLPEIVVQNKIIPVVLDSPVALVQARSADGGGRLILDSANNSLFTYEIKAEGNYLEMVITAASVKDTESQEVVAMITGHGAEGARDEMMMMISDEEYGEPAESGQPGNDVVNTVGFGGYDQQKISVDFYKIDLHNVFRLIGEISNRNVIVDESVSGSLTLSMKDVPWDFLLDVVLNLKDLAKEERFNTIVISPKSEGFAWPETTSAQLEVTVEPITVKKRMQTSREKVEAKKLIHQGTGFEEKGQIVEALKIYEEAMQIWPENGDLAKRIASLALVKLGQNAKAAHYAMIAVREHPDDYMAALIAAMSLANMEKTEEAKEYFDLAVSSQKPSKHALASYAAFSEQNGSYDAALNLLEQFTQVYGNSLETMVSNARIYDKMGDAARADEEYKAIQLSGFELPADLKAYLSFRVR